MQLTIGKKNITFQGGDQTALKIPKSKEEAEELMGYLASLSQWVEAQVKSVADAYAASYGIAETIDDAEQFVEDNRHYFAQLTKQAEDRAKELAEIDKLNLSPAVKKVLSKLSGTDLKTLAS